jgi:hypothetical protein
MFANAFALGEKLLDSLERLIAAINGLTAAISDDTPTIPELVNDTPDAA